MADLKIRLKFGDLEFECEGDPASVREERDWWLKKFVADHPAQVAAATKSPESDSHHKKESAKPTSGSSSNAALQGVFKKDDKGSLTLAAKLPGDNRVADAGLLLLWGYKEYGGEDAISAVKLVAGLKESGYTFDRLDRQVVMALKEGGYILSSGTKRGTRYRITNSGVTKGKVLAQEISALM